MQQPQHKRLSEQQKQEYRSRDQLADRFDEYGWVPDPISRDLGEDFLVRIYDAGVASGLTFFVQMKSVRDLEQVRIINGYISYPIDVKDLEHWAVSAVPVLIVVWDVNTRSGIWAAVPDVAKELDGRNPRWRGQKEVRVRLPPNNGTDDQGLSEMRSCVAHYYYPLIAHNKPLEIRTTFSFPKTPEGQAAYLALTQHFATGEAAEIPGQYIQQFEFSEWWTRLFGPVDMSKGHLTIGSGVSEQSIPVRIDLVSSGGLTASIPAVDLRAIKAGSEQITLSNEHQPDPLHMRFVFTRPSGEFQVSFKLIGPGATVQETRDTLLFMRALAGGGILRITGRSNGIRITGKFPKGMIEPPHQAVVEVVEQLCFIQQETGYVMALDKEWSLSHEDVQVIDELIDVFKTGRAVLHNRVFTGHFKRDATSLFLEYQRTGRPIHLRITADDGYVDLLGVRISLGPFTQEISGMLDVSPEELRTAVEGMGPEDELEIRLVGASVIEEFVNWPRRTGTEHDGH